MKDFIAESERRFDERFPFGLEVPTDETDKSDCVKSFYRTELLAAYEKGRKDFGEEVMGKVEGMREQNAQVSEYYSGYNSALSAVVSLIRESVGEKLPEGE